ncbi:hypothetical protein [Mucilaginibacter sp. BT774]|uniref:hypothetical protein n=1 Tax=Mucilaginibacter sp. BT774 TaxID=3062276 RepID=UPI00267578BB|nr:hypothetical protein [Mucilaginibacter sp. BT774]MDO3626882.1 hypothetical protein [Mucilaginibacter sp. BT774]
MNKYFFVLVLFCFSCMNSELQSRAEQTAEHYVRNRLGNPAYFKSVSFSAIQKRRYTTSLDTSLNAAGISAADRQRMKTYVDSENGQRPDLAVKNEKDVYSIEHDKLTYYLLIYSFRTDSAGVKKLMKYRLELDTACNVINATDVTNVKIKE